MKAFRHISSIIMIFGAGLLLSAAMPSDAAILRAKKPVAVKTVKTEKKTVRQLRRDTDAPLPRPVKRGAAEAATAEGPLPLKDIEIGLIRKAVERARGNVAMQTRLISEY